MCQRHKICKNITPKEIFVRFLKIFVLLTPSCLYDWIVTNLCGCKSVLPPAYSLPALSRGGVGGGVCNFLFCAPIPANNPSHNSIFFYGASAWKNLTWEIFLGSPPVKKSHVRNFSGRPSREKISLTFFHGRRCWFVGSARSQYFLYV